MIASIQSEFRKLLSVRSTYILIILGLLITLLLSFFFQGYKGSAGSPASNLEPTAIKEIINSTAGLIAVFISLVAILSIGHEYRYNTILYTLTTNTRRSRVLLAKLFSISIFSLVVGFISVALAIGGYMFGLSLRDATLPTQDFQVMSHLGIVSAYFLGYGLMSLLIGLVIRSLVGAIAFFFIVPATVESLLSVVLKDNSAYLPFSALDSIIGQSITENSMSPYRAILVSAIYLAVGWGIAWILFLRRDAI